MRILKDKFDVRERYKRMYATSEKATVYQSLEWLEVLLKGLSGELIFLEIDDTLIPFICKGKGPFKRCRSLPYDTYGGPLTTKDIKIKFEEVVETLKAPLIRIVDFWGYVESRSYKALSVSAHLLDISHGYEEVRKSYSKGLKKALKQAENRGVVVRKIVDENFLPVFYNLYSQTVKKFGKRPFPYPLIKSIFEVMVPKNMANFYLAWYNDEPVGSNLILRGKEEAYGWVLGYREDYLYVRPTNAMIDKAICDEVEVGTKIFNLGATPMEKPGVVRFKESFGAKKYEYRVFSKIGFSYKLMKETKEKVLWIRRKFWF